MSENIATLLMSCTLIATIFSGLLIYFAYRSRPGPGSTAATALFLSLFIYSLGYTLELFSNDIAQILRIIGFEYIGISTAPVFLLICILRYEGFTFKAIRFLLPFLFFIPVLTIFITLTPFIVPMMYQEVWLDTANSFSVFMMVPGFWWYIINGWNVMVLTITLFILLILTIKNDSLFRIQTGLMIIGLTVPFAALLFNLSGMRPILIDFTPFALIITGITMIPAISRYHLFNIIPIAYERIFHSMQFGVVILDTLGKIRGMNPAACQIFHADESACIGESYSSALPKGEIIRDLLQNSSDNRFELAIEGEMTDEVYLVDFMPVQEHNAGKSGSLLMFTRITDRKKEEKRIIEYADIISKRNTELETLKEQLEVLNQNLNSQVKERTKEVDALLFQKDRFIQQIAHDLRSPLIPLVGLIPFLIEQEQDPDLSRLISQMKQSIDTMQQTVEGLIHLAHLNSLHRIDEMVILEVGELVRDAINQEDTFARQNHISIFQDIEPGLQVLLSPVWGKVIFPHLIENAIRYNNPGGSVWISGSKGNESIHISISDNGIGITSDDLGNIFTEFYQVDTSRHNLESKGLGLSLVRQILTLSGGKIWAESDGIGKGSTFHISLPLHDRKI